MKGFGLDQNAKVLDAASETNIPPPQQVLYICKGVSNKQFKTRP